jgi:hypothetical protein
MGGLPLRLDGGFLFFSICFLFLYASLRSGSTGPVLTFFKKSESSQIICLRIIVAQDTVPVIIKTYNKNKIKMK